MDGRPDRISKPKGRRGTDEGIARTASSSRQVVAIEVGTYYVLKPRVLADGDILILHRKHWGNAHIRWVAEEEEAKRDNNKYRVGVE